MGVSLVFEMASTWECSLVHLEKLQPDAKRNYWIFWEEVGESKERFWRRISSGAGKSQEIHRRVICGMWEYCDICNTWYILCFVFMWFLLFHDDILNIWYILCCYLKYRDLVESFHNVHITRMMINCLQ